jgi:fumarate reductase subunit D
MTLRFYKNSNGIIFVDLGWFSNFSYILATITRIVITSLGIILRHGLLEKTGMDYKLTFFFFGEAMTIFLLVTIIFDFLLIYGKAALAGMHRRMLIHYKLILSGKEEVKEETR